MIGRVLFRHAPHSDGPERRPSNRRWMAFVEAIWRAPRSSRLASRQHLLYALYWSFLLGISAPVQFVVLLLTRLTSSTLFTAALAVDLVWIGSCFVIAMWHLGPIRGGTSG